MKTKKFRKTAGHLADLYEMKNAAYGNSFSKTYKQLGLISALTRMSDKMHRLINLATNSMVDNLGESIDDTLRDLACYSIMTLMEREEERMECSAEEMEEQLYRKHHNEPLNLPE